MLRALYSGISGLRSHQTMLDVTGNNIANVNTTAFKGSAVRFQDTLSQMSQGAAAPQDAVGGSNPAQVGLGVQVAGISTNFVQGSAQSTGRATDMMINGDGFFVTSLAGETRYTRAGSFDFDGDGRLVTADGAILQGWNAVNGEINGMGTIGNISLPLDAVAPAKATDNAALGGNLPYDAAVGDTIVKDIQVYDAAGTASMLELTFTKTANAGEWDVFEGATDIGPITFAADGSLTTTAPLTAGAITVDVASLTGYAELSTLEFVSQNGRDAGVLEGFSMAKDGTLVGSYSNGTSEALGRVALATFANPGGLEKTGGSSYLATFNSGVAELGTANTGGFGSLSSGSLEMSNVDLSQEFTNLIIAQRGFQANARIITTSDEILQELTNLKR